MANNTGNPIGSTAAKDLSDNAENLDKLLNGEEYEYTDRLGRERKSLKWMEDAALAIPAIDAALRSEQQAERSEQEAERSRDEADKSISARSGSEVARDAAQLSAGVFMDKASGLANTPPDSFFNVPSTESSEYLILYQNVAGIAVEVKRYPSAGYVTRVAMSAETKQPVAEIDQIATVVKPNYFFNGDIYTGWSVGFISAAPVINFVELDLHLSYNAGSNSLPLPAYFILNLRSRSVAASAAVVPNAANSELLLSQRFEAADVAPAMKFTDGLKPVRFNFAPLLVSQDRYTFAEVLMYAADGTLAMSTSIGAIKNATGVTQNERGYFKHGSEGTWRLIVTDQLSIKSGYSAQGVERVIENKLGLFEHSEVAGNVMTDSTTWVASTQSAATMFFSWSVGLSSAPGIAFDGVGLWLEKVLSNKTLVLRVGARPNTASADASPFVGGSDQPLFMAEYVAADLVKSNDMQLVRFRLPAAIQLSADFYPIVEVVGLSEDGAPGLMGCGRRTISGAEPKMAVGFFRRAGSPSILNAIVASGGGGVPVQFFRSTPTSAETLVEQLAIVETYGSRLDAVEAKQAPNLLDRYLPSIAIAANTLNFSGSHAYVDGVDLPFGGALQLDATAGGSDTKTAVGLQYVSAAAQWPNNVNDWLGRKNISAVVVTKVSTDQVLTAGTDYSVDAYGGKLRGLVNVASFPVNVTFNYLKERYDLIQINPATLALSVVKGAERDFDVQEYRPEADPGQVPLAYALVVGSKVQIEPIYRYFNGEGLPFGSDDARGILENHNRKTLRKTRAKLARGTPIKLIGYGDSITAVSRASSPESTPNGPTRDQQQFLAPGYGTDTLTALYPAQDWADGGGAVHVKIGWNWKLIEMFENAYGVGVTYLNFGVSGTNSASGASTSRLNNVLAGGGDLMVLCFGMNDNGSPSLYSNMRSIISQAVEAGIEVVVMPIPRTPTQSAGLYSLDAWRAMNRQCYRAALDAGAAWVPANILTDDNSRGGMGIHSDSLCGANLRNHPGAYELSVYGEALKRLFY